jgi:signal transduction histidine kinase
MPRTGFGTGYQWYRLPLSVSDTAARQLLLEIGLAQVPEATVFVQRGGLLDSFARAGTRWPFAQRALPYRLLAFPVAVQPGERLQLFVRLRGDGSNRSMPFMLWDQDRWLAHRRTRLTLNTAFFAVMSTIAVFGLIISVVIATPFRWPWFGFTLSGAGLTAVYTGLAHAWIWPGSSYAQLASPQLLANTTFFAGVALLQVLYRTRTEHPDLDRGFRGLRVSFLASAALALAMPVVPAPLRTLLFCANEGLFLTACAWILGSVWTLYRRQKRWEPLLMVVALAPQSLAISLHALQNLMLLRMGSVLFALDWMGVITVTFLLTLILLRRIRLLMDEGFQVVSDAVVRRRQNTYALLSRESEVRKAIGQDIDQRLGPLMDAAQRKLTAFRPPLHDLQEQLRAAQAEIRGICDNRIPSNLTEHGLLAALGEIIRPLEAAGTQVSCQYPRPRRLEKLDLLYQLVLFRIAQGLLNNVYKHAQARNVMLSMRVVGGRVFLDLRDDGVGFEPDRAGGGGRGLAIIRQRVETLGGTFAVQSRGGGGSFFQVQIPLKF